MDSVNDLEQQLKEAGENLALPPSSFNHLLDLLDKTKQLLTRVGQAPSVSMQRALVPPMGALIADELITHSDIDVRISVAACLCEVARITAPEQSYKDEVMKEIFRLNVMAFEQLGDVTGRSYYKVIHILQSVAKVKSCLLMLDLECDALVLEMFEQFLTKIRISHPHTVFSDVETIMTLIIEESDEVATELLSLLISHVKQENQFVSPASWKLAEKVLRNCKDTLKPYHETIRKLVKSKFDDYAEVVALLCQFAYESEHVVTRSTLRTNSTHKRDTITLDNGRSMKKQKYIDKNQFKGKELDTPKRGRPKKNKNNINLDISREDTRRTRFQDKRQSSNTKGNIKNSGSSDKGSGGKDIPKKWGEDLVGHRIKVWWPLDEMYYKGVVFSYDPRDDKHRVLYADGDEEVLDLHNEKWKMLDEISPDQQHGKVTKNPESSPTQEDNSNSPKSPPPSDANQKDNLVLALAVSDGLTSTEQTIDNVEKNGESDPSGELPEKSLLEMSETTQRLEKPTI
ncbi:putative sister chromatid cohesion protein Pds5 [Helianthus annuus]|nr:putative sister chromatid cohesion protein Pds5 [Helianthus annuus]KAJ0709421.1 putative sister chromatid cohesion protein Pds5 [Helianthus annuus]KAJ0713294.1 putative sister chromatid cohesion protein Pds5 [Helianthus annuus]KAJ0895395.1 putative sister chromatid cohesion protein Pds5 [Helianthus annuus]